MQKCRDMGWCFNCDEKYTVGNRSKVPKLMLVEGTEAEDEEEPEVIGEEPRNWRKKIKKKKKP